MDIATQRAWALNDPQMMRIAGTLIGPDSRVLDVACDTGGLLEALGQFAPRARVGVDRNVDAVEYGRQMLAAEDATLRVGDGTQLPYNGEFDIVFCVNALSYMHQERALRSMARALVDDGVLVLAYETMTYDLVRLRTRNPEQFLRAMRNFVFGSIVAITGRQPGFSRGRAFVSDRRLRKTLGALGFNIETVMARNKGQKFFGRPSQKVVIARKAKLTTDRGSL